MNSQSATNINASAYASTAVAPFNSSSASSYLNNHSDFSFSPPKKTKADSDHHEVGEVIASQTANFGYNMFFTINKFNNASYNNELFRTQNVICFYTYQNVDGIEIRTMHTLPMLNVYFKDNELDMTPEEFCKKYVFVGVSRGISDMTGNFMSTLAKASMTVGGTFYVTNIWSPSVKIGQKVWLVITKLGVPKTVYNNQGQAQVRLVKRLVIMPYYSEVCSNPALSGYRSNVLEEMPTDYLDYYNSDVTKYYETQIINNQVVKITKRAKFILVGTVTNNNGFDNAGQDGLNYKFIDTLGEKFTTFIRVVR